MKRLHLRSSVGGPGRLLSCLMLVAGMLFTGVALASHPEEPPATYEPDVTFTLRTDIAEGKMVFVGEGGDIDGVVNPRLAVDKGEVVQINLIDGDGALHDISFPAFSATSEKIQGRGASTTLVFRAGKTGTFAYFCTVPGHRAAGMEGELVVGGERGAKPAAEKLKEIVRDPSDVPPPVGDRAPRTVKVSLETVELKARLADGTSYTYWTFDGTVPGPMLRVRVGDTLQVTLKNRADSKNIHSVDFHAVTGPGGGAHVLQVPPGREKTASFKAMAPGIYVYHCATPSVPHHIAAGMYGLILVEPEGGLPKVDREFYVMQGEIYTTEPFGTKGNAEFSYQKMLDENPEYFVLNGAAGALTNVHPMKAEVGETVRLYFGVGGPNFTSSFHVIGEIFDRVYNWGSLTSEPVTDIQAVSVPPGGAIVTDFKLDVPGKYILVDHALSRLERGLVGHLIAEGEDNPQVFRVGPAQ